MLGKSSLGRYLDLFYPRSCLLCEKPLRGADLCSRCSPAPINLTSRCDYCFTPCEFGIESCTLCKLIPSPISRTRFLWNYEGRARDLIAVIKYRPSAKLADYLALQSSQEIAPLFPDKSWEIIVPVPCSAKSLMQRGFSPPLRLAQAAKDTLKLNVPISTTALTRLRKNQPQASLKHQARARNVLGVFAPGRGSVAGKKVLLVDDVITTGATSTMVALALSQAGAASVELFAAARSPSWQEFRWVTHEQLMPVRVESAGCK